MKSALEKNREYSEKFIQPISNPKVPKEIKDILEKNKVKSMIDLGCGDGALIRAVKKDFPKIRIVGMDISPRRINNLKDRFPKDRFYCRDICDTGLKNNSFDLVNSSQVIEHVEDDEKLVREVYRLLKKDGFLIVDTVIKKSWAIYKYKNRFGKFALDPTHEREYKNAKEFLDLFKKDFKLIKYWIKPVRRKVFSKDVRIPGYYLIYGIWKKRK